MSKKYTDEFLISELQRFVKENGRNPTCRDVKISNNYPGKHAYFNHFGTWNNALIAAGLKINQRWHKLTGEEYCNKCGSVYTSSGWIYKNDTILCAKCYHSDRNYFYGILNPDSCLGLGIIAEYIVYTVLGDCKKCNTKDNFNTEYDLISNKYGNVNVKSSKLCNNNKISYYWQFTKNKNTKVPNYYICLGFDKNRNKILKVWIISGNSKVVKNGGIWITNSEKYLSKFKEYEVNPTLYNEIYKNINIYNLPEFKNLNDKEGYDAAMVSTN